MPVLQALRAATERQHREIEALLRFDEALDGVRYARILGGFALFLRGWEPKVLSLLPERLQAWFTARSRLPFLERDLHCLGVGPAGARPLPLRLPNLAGAFGSMYVIEGSALGGQVLARQLQQQLGLDAASGAAYFAGWGRDTGAMWAGFRESLVRELGDDASAHEAACDGALRTFQALIETFQSVLADGRVAA